MKSKIVLWGNDAQDEKILIAIALRAEENKVDIWTFPESVATEDFYQQMMKEWRDGAGLELPEPHTHLERELSVTESLLPDDIKVERTDSVQRAQTEWHFIVLSSKLHHAYAAELEELKEKVEKLEDFDQAMWGTLKEFWGKLQEQVRERNLFRDHADKLRNHTNALFSKMKELRSKMDGEFEQVSQEAHDKFMAAIEEIEKKMSEGSRLRGLFEDLKNLQSDFRSTKFTREHRSKVWDKLNAAFKKVKQKRFGNRSDDGSSQHQRLQRRFDGLLSAIGKMESSIWRDRKDLEFQHHKIDTTHGQLEAQIRQAKIVMIEERVRSKEEKLAEMKGTQVTLEARLKQMDQREARQAAKNAARQKIAGEMKAAAEARKASADKLDKAAKEIAGGKKDASGDSVIDAVSATLGESLEDVVDTVKAVASVISGKIEDAIEDLKDDLAEPEAAKPAAGEDAPAAEPAETAETPENAGEPAEDVLVGETVDAENAAESKEEEK
jgi:hypothetical protein